MFKFSQLKQIHLEITNNCQASCPMCARNIKGGLDNPLIKTRDWSLTEFQKTMTADVLKQIDSFYLCGNFGDPILNGSLIDMVAYSRSVSPDTAISIHTNGGARNVEWWRSLAQSLPIKHRVVFAIDGLSDTHHLYRVGTKYETVLDNAKSFIDNGGIAEWVFIRFKHNQHQVEEARQIAKQFGFKHFTVKNSIRFVAEPKIDVVNRKGQITHSIEPATDVPLKFIDRKTIESYKQIVAASVIDCKVKHEKEVYIDAHGDLLPCCWLGNIPYSYIDPNEIMSVRTDMVTQYNNLKKDLGNTNVFVSSVKDIIDSDTYQTIWDHYWTVNKLITCAKTCGLNTEFSKPRDQIVH